MMFSSAVEELQIMKKKNLPGFKLVHYTPKKKRRKMREISEFRKSFHIIYDHNRKMAGTFMASNIHTYTQMPSCGLFCILGDVAELYGHRKLSIKFRVVK